MGENQLKGRKEFEEFMPSKLSVYGIVSIIPGPVVSQVEEGRGRGQGQIHASNAFPSSGSAPLTRPHLISHPA